jgi:ketosteroid isomerase-like protein
MPQENVEVIRAATNAWNRGDRATLARLLHPDVEWQTILGPLVGVATVRGRDAVLKFLFEDIPDAIDRPSAVAEELTDLGNGRVLVVATYRGRGRRGGVDVEVRISSVHRISGGVILSVRDYANRREALEAVGLSE